MRKEYRRQKARENFVNYICKTWRNKLGAMFLIATGLLGVVVVKDATALMFMMCFAIPMFFSRRNWFC